MAKRPLPVNGNAPQTVEMAERTLPHNLEAERSVIGAVLVHNAAFELATGVITAEDFFRDAHRRIWLAMVKLSEAKQPVDFVTLKNALSGTGELDDVGGPAYVASLADGVPRATNVAHYAQIVKEKATLRAIIYTAQRLTGDAYESSEDASAILSRADRAFLDLQNGHGNSGLVDVRQSYKRLYNDLEDRQANKGGLRGVTTGFASIDDLTLGPGQTARHVYLPQGTWVDWYTGERHAGGQFITASAPLDRIPIFARGLNGISSAIFSYNSVAAAVLTSGMTIFKMTN